MKDRSANSTIISVLPLLISWLIESSRFLIWTNACTISYQIPSYLSAIKWSGSRSHRCWGGLEKNFTFSEILIIISMSTMKNLNAFVILILILIWNRFFFMLVSFVLIPCLFVCLFVCCFVCSFFYFFIFSRLPYFSKNLWIVLSRVRTLNSRNK